MFNRPIYQASIVFLSLLALAGGIALLLAQGGPTGVVITQPPERTTSSEGTPEVQVAGEPSDALVDINSATANELVALPGVGPVLSERIVAYRQANGRFERADQLMAVAGIGPATYEAIRDLITVGD
ncbi:MAG: helix-hairpin-helix domain-containing protein [Chloroflexi bacterium]|nr:helix-hairpin-helix domain-containing protein [Chloroflexota bacterium]